MKSTLELMNKIRDSCPDLHGSKVDIAAYLDSRMGGLQISAVWYGISTYTYQHIFSPEKIFNVLNEDMLIDEFTSGCRNQLEAAGFEIREKQ